MEMNYCRRCGRELEQVNGHVYKCKNDHIIFANASPSIGVFFVTDTHEVILPERGIEPHKGMLDAFGGFLDGEETVEDAVARELKEELNLDPTDYMELHFLCSGTGHYPYKGEVLPVVSTFFWTRLASGVKLVPADDVAAVRTIPIHDVRLDQLHDEDIRIGIKKLQAIFPQI